MMRVLLFIRYMWRRSMANSVAASIWTPMFLRRRLLGAYGVEFEDDSIKVLPFCQFSGHQVRLGTATFINEMCQFRGSATIEIGARCCIANEVSFCTSTHEMGDESKRAGAVLFLPIRVGDGCWLGTRVTVLAGVTIGAGCMIAAGSVVTKDCQPNGLYGGVPARRLREL